MVNILLFLNHGSCNISYLKIDFSQITRTLQGYSNILVYGNEVQPGCKIHAGGTNEGDSVITVDFGQGPCTSGYSVALNEGSIFIGNDEIISFGSPYKDIILILSNCNDQVIISKTYADVTSVEVQGNNGDDNIVLGDTTQALDIDMHGSIIIDGGVGSDVLSILDQGSSISKTIEVQPSKLQNGEFKIYILYIPFLLSHF